MRQHPIPPVNEPLQFRAIGIVRGTYCPTKTDVLTRGNLTTVDGSAIDAVLLGRVLSLVKRHLNLEQEHLWVVYPRSRDDQKLHLQVVGVWEPSTLASDEEDLADSLPEGDGFFSVRGELIYTKPETGDLVIKIRQLPRADGSRPQPFKLQLKGNIPLEHLRHFLDLRVRLQGELLQIEHWEVIAPMPQRSDRRGGAAKKRGQR
ncbi:MAG: hypothetical protein EBX33_07755 [Synechococcaceae bacterium WB8_1A_041]|nr:hypothetical protein [Synechococcaceae bacterium WB8_1A_041]